jgi:hypothetical protein
MRIGRLQIPRVSSQDLRQGARRLWPDRLEAAVLIMLSVAIAYQLFAEPIIGMADNRDFARLMDPAGLDYRSVADYRESVFQFVETKFAFVKRSSYRYLTSQRPVLGAAKVLNGLIAKDDKFDIRSLGLCNLALYLVAVFIFLRAFRGMGLAAKLFVAAAVLLMGVDVKWIAYFNSFYCESASLVFLFSTLGFALLCLQGERQGPTAWLLWLAYLTSAFLFWMAKSQNTAFAPCLALGAFCLVPSSNLRGRRYFRLLGTAAVPIGVVWAFLAGAYGVTVPTNAQVVWDEEIAPHSTTLADDKRELGIARGGPSLARVALFYAHHPMRWWRMAERQAKEAFGYPPLGNFTRGSGFAPKAQSQAFNAWSEFKKAHYPRSLALLVGLFGLYCLLAGMKARWLDEGPLARMRTLAGPVLALGCTVEFIAVVTFEANGTAKHFFIFNVAVDLCLLLFLLSLGEAFAQLWRRRRAVVAG